ncbi:hypothetical protein [Cytobacillus oceanisediminis]|uniref:hypothetical protein n=1 Tax=Cytobacillus oceanisediminis TaxID=665099 RepID=UPI001FB21EE6|nr:hypothetical protein [Cytobacillus oceanisediminis]UOE54923.1 hypothetical protein IRB79_24595 [Cytobacillus oceanisediminis]
MYEVIHDFYEKDHKNTLYKKGETYPKEPYNADPERVAYLQKDENEYKVAFLGNEIKKESKKKSSKSDSKE